MTFDESGSPITLVLGEQSENEKGTLCLQFQELWLCLRDENFF